MLSRVHTVALRLVLCSRRCGLTALKIVYPLATVRWQKIQLKRGRFTLLLLVGAVDNGLLLKLGCKLSWVWKAATYLHHLFDLAQLCLVRNTGIIYLIFAPCPQSHSSILLKKSGSNTPRVELQEMGPSMDLVLRRVSLAAPDLYRLSCKAPKQLKVRGVHLLLECV